MQQVKPDNGGGNRGNNYCKPVSHNAFNIFDRRTSKSDELKSGRFNCLLLLFQKAPWSPEPVIVLARGKTGGAY
jgi:hypothetical protein